MFGLAHFSISKGMLFNYVVLLVFCALNVSSIVVDACKLIPSIRQGIRLSKDATNRWTHPGFVYPTSQGTYHQVGLRGKVPFDCDELQG